MGDTPRRRPSPASAFVAGGGAMGVRLRALDWGTTPLGPIAGWPEVLKTSVDQMMASRFPACLFWGPELIAIYNDGYKLILGHKDEALGRPMRTTWSEVWDALQPIAHKALAGETTYIEDWRLEIVRDRQPDTAYFTFCYSPVFDADGRVAGMLDIVIETTGRVAAEHRAAVQQERQRRMLQQMPGFVAMLAGPQHMFEYVNDAYREVAGVRDYLGRTVREVFPDLHDQDFFGMLDRVYKTGEAISAKAVPIRFAGDDGDRHVDLLYEPVHDEDGRVHGIFVGGYDVTDRLRAEATLLTTQQSLRALTEARLAERTAERDVLAHIVESTNAQIQVVGSDYRFLAINTACADEYLRLFGLRPGVGDDLREVLARIPDDAEREASMSLWRRALSGESFTLKHEWGEGDRKRWFQMNFEVLRTGGGVQTGAFLTSNDITEQRRAETALAQAQDALRQAQKMEAVGQLTGGIAHDFNNLLAAISSSLQVMKIKLSRDQPAGLQRYVDISERSVRRAAALTHRLLAFSRRQTLDPRATDVNELVRSMEDLIRRTVGPAVEYRFDKAADVWATCIDASQLENSLLNLCINARDAMSSLGGRLAIETANIQLTGAAAGDRVLPEGEYVRISVSDEGTGIAPEDVGRIFEPFYTTKPTGQGTGLGLSMVYGFVQQSDGQVQVESVLGEGTTMHLYLPRHHGTVDEPPRAVDPEPIARGDGETVLIVEDEEHLRELIAEVLGEAGYRILTAEDGPTGLRKLQESGRIDLLLTDVGLPGGLNGRQVADAGRLLRPALQVLLVTGYAEKVAMGSGLLEPWMQVMTKPFEIAALVQQVKTMLQRPVRIT